MCEHQNQSPAALSKLFRGEKQPEGGLPQSHLSSSARRSSSSTPCAFLSFSSFLGTALPAAVPPFRSSDTGVARRSFTPPQSSAASCGCCCSPSTQFSTCCWLLSWLSGSLSSSEVVESPSDWCPWPSSSALSFSSAGASCSSSPLSPSCGSRSRPVRPQPFHKEEDRSITRQGDNTEEELSNSGRY